jgi:Rha family phage regulatory protein
MKTELALGTSAQNGADDTAPAVALSTYQIADESLVTTTSLQVAQHFKKRHDNVLRRIRTLECSPEFRRLNFEETIYSIPGPKNSIRTEVIYHMTRDGFFFVIMNFTGKEAVQWREAYSRTFNAMEKALRTHYVEALIDDKQFRQGIPLKFKLMMQDQGLRLRKQLRAEPDHDNRVALYWSLFQVNSSLGVPTESMAVLVGEAPPTPGPPRRRRAMTAAPLIYRKKAVLEKFGISETTLRRWMKEEEFPRPRQLGPRAVGWLSGQVTAWLDARPWPCPISWTMRMRTEPHLRKTRIA